MWLNIPEIWIFISTVSRTSDLARALTLFFPHQNRIRSNCAGKGCPMQTFNRNKSISIPTFDFCKNLAFWNIVWICFPRDDGSWHLPYRNLGCLEITSNALKNPVKFFFRSWVREICVKGKILHSWQTQVIGFGSFQNDGPHYNINYFLFDT
jgi:hypothetical protein